MKRLLITLCLLSLCVLPISDIGHTQQTISVVPDNKPIRFKVFVYVEPKNDSNLDTKLEAFIRRELRALGDVDLVKIDSDYDFYLRFNFLEHTFKAGGSKTGWVSIAQAVLDTGFLRNENISVIEQISENLYGKHGYLQTVTIANWPTDDLHEYAIEVAGGFDKFCLQEWRTQ